MDCKHERQARLDQWIDDVQGIACAFCLKAEVERLKGDYAQAKEAIAHLEQGKPLGELVGKQTIANQMAEINRLKAAIETIGTDADPVWVEACRLKTENEMLNTKVAMEQRTVSRFERRTTERWNENNKLRKALEPFVKHIRLHNEVHISPKRDIACPAGPTYADYDRANEALKGDSSDTQG